MKEAIEVTDSQRKAESLLYPIDLEAVINPIELWCIIEGREEVLLEGKTPKSEAEDTSNYVPTAIQVKNALAVGFKNNERGEVRSGHYPDKEKRRALKFENVSPDKQQHRSVDARNSIFLERGGNRLGIRPTDTQKPYVAAENVQGYFQATASIDTLDELAGLEHALKHGLSFGFDEEQGKTEAQVEIETGVGEEDVLLTDTDSTQSVTSEELQGVTILTIDDLRRQTIANESIGAVEIDEETISTKGNLAPLSWETPIPNAALITNIRNDNDRRGPTVEDYSPDSGL